MTSGKLLGEESMDVGLGQSREHGHSDNSGGRDSRERNIDVMAPQSLFTDCGSSSALHLRWVIFFHDGSEPTS